jgi:hypothetical protein
MGISMSGGPYSYNRFDDYQAMISEKKAAKDYDGDGKVESGSKEHAGSVHNAIQRATGGTPDGKDTRKEQMDMYVAALGRMGQSYVPMMEKKKDSEPEDERKEAADRGFEAKRQKKEGKYGEAHETEELEKEEDKKDKEDAKEAFENGWNAALLELPEEKVRQAKKMSEKKLEKGLDKDTHSEAFDAGYAYCLDEAKGAGSPAKMAASVRDEAKSNKKETDAMAFASKKQRRGQAVNAAEQFVMESLIEDGLANNMVSAETIMLHMSDEWFDQILDEMGPAFPSETKAQAKAQSDHREGKSSKGLKTGKNPGLKMSHTSGANRQD